MFQSIQPQDNTLTQLKAGKLQGSQQLKLSCGLTQFPQEIFDLADSLEILDLTGNALSDLPKDLNRLKKLRILFCSSNQFTHLPEVLGECQNLSMIGFKANQIRHIPEGAIPTTSLRWFIMTDNALKAVPNALGECRQLQKLMLAGNQLKALPESMANCHALELLRISANQFNTIPNFLFNLPKLTWLAYAGNPFCDKFEDALIAQHHIPQIDWDSLQIQQQLGEGASGNIYQAIWQTEAGNKTVAVKMFKANLTSDGLPRCEVHATALANQHPNLLGLEGIIYNHPANAAGLVMPLMDADLTVLADPPSFESCTRDVYAPNTQFSLQTILHIAHSVASAASHLHARGITHGDLYAHNILTNHKGTTAKKCTLTDLGGASFLPQNNLAQSLQLQRIESRAFACLLEELLTYCNINNQTTSLLWQLQAECGQENVALRPLFNEIIQKLNLMQPL